MKKITENNDKQVFTTGEAAKICNVSQQTIIRCFDSGRLQGFKVPGSKFRRIPRHELVRFMKQNNMDLSRFGTNQIQVLVVGLSEIETDSIIQNHASGHNVQIIHAGDAWEAGFLAHKCNPSLVLIYAGIVGINEQSVRNSLVGSGEIEPAVVIIDNNYHNGMNMPPQNDEHKEVIKNAVIQLLSA